MAKCAWVNLKAALVSNCHNHHSLLIQRLQACGIAFWTGRVNTKVLPFFSSLSTQIWPPCPCTMLRQMPRPRPVPRGRSLNDSSACVNSSKIAERFDSGMPMPVSETLMCTLSPTNRTRQVMAPSLVNFTALEMRLTMTWISRSRSPRTGGRPDSISTRETRPESLTSADHKFFRHHPYSMLH